MKKMLMLIFLCFCVTVFAKESDTDEYDDDSEDMTNEISLIKHSKAPVKETQDNNDFYATGLCSKANFKCITLKHGDSWTKLFPDEVERDLVQRINRLDTAIGTGKTIAVPVDLKKTTLFDVSPFPLQVKSPGEKLVIVDQYKLAWGAYDEKGKLLRWGPVSSGKDYCPDVHRSCKTLTGIFHVFHKKGDKCRSNVFPVEKGGGSPMPYCMFYFKGYALHGSNEVSGKRESHGCVRMFTRDAIWLNQSFVDAATKEGNQGTKVVIQKLVTDMQ